MKTHYTNEHSSAEVVKTTIEGADGVLELVRVWTDPEARRQGYATELVKAICTDADIEGRVLMLNPKPFGQVAGLRDLAPWYARFGFVEIQKSPRLMARPPQPYQTRLSPMAGAISEVLRG